MVANTLFSRLSAFSAFVIPAFVWAQADYAATLKPGARVTVDIAGYKYQGTYTGPTKCRDGGQCVGVTDDDGVKKQLLPRYIKPPQAGAAAKAEAGRSTKPVGLHVCRAYSGGMLINVGKFTLNDNGTFRDQSGGGRWTWDAANSMVSFSGGAWNGQKARKLSDGSLNVQRADGGGGGATSCTKE
ncbi:MAG: hypothetical protein V4542_15030 [Pseudomonadota bacterium]